MPKRIYVGNLPVKAEPRHLEDFCNKHGVVTKVQVKGSKAIIDMSSGIDSAAKALKAHKPGGNTLEIVVNHEEQDVLI